MVTKSLLEKHSNFLRLLHETKSVLSLKKLLKEATLNSLRVLLSLIKDAIQKKVQLNQNKLEGKKLLKYKDHLRNLVSAHRELRKVSDKSIFLGYIYPILSILKLFVRPLFHLPLEGTSSEGSLTPPKEREENGSVVCLDPSFPESVPDDQEIQN